MSQFNTSLEFLLKVRAEGQAVLDSVNKQIEGFVAAQGKAGAANLGAAAAGKDAAGATATLTEAQRQASHAIAASNSEITLQRGALAGLAAQARTALTAYVGLAGARRALALNQAQEQAEQRLLGVLQAQAESRDRAIEQQRELLGLAAQLQADIGIFGDEDFLGAARQFVAVSGRTDLDFERLLRVSADAAVALYDNNLETAVRNIARTFGGQAGEIGEVIPEIAAIRRELAPRQFAQALQEGLVVDLLERRFGGAAAEARDSESGRQIALQARLGDQLERLGGVLLPGLNLGLELLITAADAASDALSSVAGAAGGDDGAPGRRSYGTIPEGFGAAVDFAFSAVLARLRPGDVGVQQFQASQLADALDSREFRRGLDLSARTLDLLGLGDLAKEIRALRESNSDALRLLAGRAPNDPLPAFEGGAPANKVESRVDFDDATRRELVAQLGLVDELNAELIGLEDSFRRLAGFEEFPIRLFDGEDAGGLREAEAFFNLAKINLTQEQGLRDLAEAQDDYARALRRANDLVEAGQISGGRRNAMLEEAREKLRAVIEDTEALGEASRAEAEKSIEAIQSLVDEEGELALDFTLGDTTQLSEDIAKAVQRAKERLTDESEELATLSAELGERAFGPLTNQLDEFLKTGEASLGGFALAVVEIFTRLASEAIVRQFLSGLLGGTPQAPGAGGQLSGVGQFLNLIGGVFGFNEGGVTPGATRGFDHRLIAVDGGEFVTPAPVVRLPFVRDHLEQVRRGDLSSIDFSRLVPRIPAPQRFPGAASVPGYNSGGFVDAFAMASSGASAEDRVFGGGGGRGQRDPIVVPVVFLDRRTAEAIQGNRASRDVIRRVARESGGADGGSSSRSGAPGGRGMPS